MAFEIHWLRRASNELDAIHQFYSEFASEQVAKCIVLLRMTAYTSHLYGIADKAVQP